MPCIPDSKHFQYLSHFICCLLATTGREGKSIVHHFSFKICVASYPSITGIWQSMKIMLEEVCFVYWILSLRFQLPLFPLEAVIAWNPRSSRKVNFKIKVVIINNKTFIFSLSFESSVENLLLFFWACFCRRT